jgi:pyruvate kinase
VTLYRGVYPVAYNEVESDTKAMYFGIFHQMLDLKLVKDGDLIILTKGALTGVVGSTNSMQILQVTRE